MKRKSLMSMLVPPHLRIAPDGGLIVDIQEWLKSAELQIEFEKTERLRKAIQKKGKKNESAR